jgi:NAD(P)-dependent dehydrogenase (short-subunit alcohol dehydrogenase family)
MSSDWKLPEAGSLRGQVTVVTGATSGLGLETAKALAAGGATVVMTARNATKGSAAQQEVMAATPHGATELMTLDLADLASVRAFAKELGVKHPRVDVLVNNAGVMATPLERTKDGFEMQIGTNHLGHVALTAAVLPLLEAATSARIVTVSSVGHKAGKIDLDDLNWNHRRYLRWPAYFQSKLANLLFTFELDRRLRAVNSTVSSLAAHPGGSKSHLGIGAGGVISGIQTAAFLAMKPLLMPTAQGAQPQIRASVDATLIGGTYVGPNGPGEFRGRPVVVKARSTAHDQKVALKLWDLSNDLTDSAWTFRSR